MEAGSFTTRITILAGILIFALGSVPADAQPGTVGLGIIVGEPTGFDAKFFLGSGNAIEAAVAWSLSGNNALHLQVDYLFHRRNLIKVEKGELPFFFGVGGRVVSRDNKDNRWGIRIPVGLAYEFEGAPFDVFVEIVPTMDFAPDTEFDLEGAIGGRFWFGGS